ncbi:MAG: Phosphate transport regulator (distant homolog of PhoU) [uncultured Caballeronia sp.]|nr:MAG: Phosphate transport regulator (distant homolog of PhoU) [uncultured Caballeronia sp.]
MRQFLCHFYVGATLSYFPGFSCSVASCPLPTDSKFFEIFNAHAKCIIDASHELELLIDNMDQMEVHKKNVQTNEKRADKLTHETIDLLHKTFITPLDHDEIHKLITTMDDILDVMP